MMEGLKDALQYVTGLGVEAETPQVLNIEGHTYANKELVRYDNVDYARAIQGSTLTAMMDYIAHCEGEFPGSMILHIVSPTKVVLMSKLDAERRRETLFETNAEVSSFRFDHWYDQERLMIELQANFEMNDDLAAVLKLAGNVEKKNEQTFSDDGMAQVATMSVGVAAKADVLVPNPVELIPYRTFQEVAQPASKFIFRIGDATSPEFKIVEAENGIWKNEAISNIKKFFYEALSCLDEVIREKIVIIG